jgi:undecaprenyl diphosphate synthase
MEKEIDGELLNVPEHVAVILDGNGRWAKKRLMPRNYGHKAGAQAVEQACEDAYNLGIRYLTVYAFSTENWKRSVEEVTGIMNLLRNYLINSVERSNKNNMKVRVIGDRTALAQDIRDAIQNLEEKTQNNTGLNFTIALNYGGRDEIRRAVQKIAEEVKEGKARVEDITEDFISAHLDTAELPDPDLLIRTSGEERTSNYLPWQIAYSEFYFTPVLWPDFKRADFVDAIRHYSKRDRRYGGVK